MLNSRRLKKEVNDIEVSKNYVVYIHTNLTNKKKYVGITHLDPKTRWNNGIGYQQNKKFYKDIQLYGWKNFSHEIIKKNLTYLEARQLETKLIKQYNSVNEGYNNTYSNTTDNIKYDFYDFAMLNNPKETYKNNVDYFTCIPNDFIQKNILKEYGINRIFLMVYVFIDRNRTYENMSYISIGEILRSCGYKTTRRKPKLFNEIIKCLLFLKENYFIDTSFDIYSIGYDDLIKIKIISKNFDAQTNFTKLYGKDLDVILNSKSTLNRENILVAFLYINSYIGCRKHNKDGSELENAKDHPEAFFRSIKKMSEELSMSKDTINQCIAYLTTSSEDSPALLVKREVGSVQPDKSKPPQNVPNIYVLNKEGYEQEIKWALEKIVQLYETDEFYPSVGKH